MACRDSIYTLVLCATRAKLIKPSLVKQRHEDFERPNFERRTPSTSSTKSSTFPLFPGRQDNPNRSPARKATLDRSPLSRFAAAPGAFTQRQPKRELSVAQEQPHVIMIVHSPARASSKTPFNVSLRRDSSSDTAHCPQSSRDANFMEAPESPIEASRPPLRKEDLPMRNSSMRAPQKPREVAYTTSFGLAPVNTNETTSMEPHVPEQRLRDTAEISIARQISVSKRQRHLLVPVVPKTVRQPMQPTVVDVREPSPCRKSHHLVLESPEEPRQR